jgi:NAD(P)-dependent dehydrogenase (short-subunit alcohol dehydrogenase family)
MAGQFEGKVAFITGAARGQGRSHAVRFAAEGADIIALDLCEQIDSVAYPMSSREDLDETINLVEKTGRRIVAERADVRDFEQVKAVVADVIANAGIFPAAGRQRLDIASFVDAVDVNLKGVYYSIEAALPELLRHGDGGAVIITSSAAGFKSVSTTFDTMSHGAAGYTASKHGAIGVMRHYATSLAEKNIRVNSVHPGGVATPMIINEAMGLLVGDQPEFGKAQQPKLSMPPMDPAEVTDAIVYFCGHSGRHLTGVALPLDGGLTLK